MANGGTGEGGTSQDKADRCISRAVRRPQANCGFNWASQVHCTSRILAFRAITPQHRVSDGTWRFDCAVSGHVAGIQPALVVCTATCSRIDALEDDDSAITCRNSVHET